MDISLRASPLTYPNAFPNQIQDYAEKGVSGLNAGTILYPLDAVGPPNWS